jgi:hypothetical protein
MVEAEFPEFVAALGSHRLEGAVSYPVRMWKRQTARSSECANTWCEWPTREGADYNPRAARFFRIRSEYDSGAMSRETPCRTLRQFSIGSAPQSRLALGQAADESARSLARLIGFPSMDQLRERLLEQGLVRIAMTEVLAKSLSVGKPTFASKTLRPGCHSIQILVKPVMGTKPFPLRAVAS